MIVLSNTVDHFNVTHNQFHFHNSLAELAHKFLQSDPKFWADISADSPVDWLIYGTNWLIDWLTNLLTHAHAFNGYILYSWDMLLSFHRSAFIYEKIPCYQDVLQLINANDSYSLYIS